MWEASPTLLISWEVKRRSTARDYKSCEGAVEISSWKMRNLTTRVIPPRNGETYWAPGFHKNVIRR